MLFAFSKINSQLNNYERNYSHRHFIGNRMANGLSIRLALVQSMVALFDCFHLELALVHICSDA